MDNRDSLDLNSPKVGKLFIKYLVPTLFGMLSMALVAAADGIFVGHGVGSDGIAAVNICIPLLMIFTGIALMCGVGSSVVASLHLARGKIKAARLNITQSILFVSIISLISTILILLFPRETSLLLGSSTSLLPLVIDYLIAFIPCIIFQMWITVGLFVIRLDGSPRVAMYCSVTTAAINMVLDWLFIFPFQMGVFGAALASTISIIIGGCATIYYLIYKAKKVKLMLPKWSIKSLQLSLRNIGYQIRIGSSALLGEFTLAMLMFMGNMTFMRYLGNDGVGAFGIACYYIPFVFMVGNAISQSAQPLISYNFGLKRAATVRTVFKYSLLTAVICGSLVTILFVFFSDYMTELFIGLETQSGQIAVHGLPYFALGFIFFISNLSIIGYYQSIERIYPATIFALLRGAIFIIPCFLLLPTVLGNTGIWLAMPLSEFLTFITVIIYQLLNKRHNKSQSRKLEMDSV